MTEAPSRRGKSAAPHKGRRRKRGRPKKKAWSTRIEFLRRHSPKYLRRTEVENLIQADFFATRTGRPLNTFISIRWIHTEHGEANINKRWTALLNAMRIWASRQGIEWAMIAVHENPERAEPAFNSHLLANIPTALYGAFAEWLKKRLGGAPEAVDIRRRTSTSWSKDNTLRYMLKGCDPQTARAFGIRYSNQGIVPFKRSATTQNINARAREEWRLLGIAQVDALRVSKKYTDRSKNKRVI